MNKSHSRLPDKTWKIIDILKVTTDYFNSKHIENPRLNAEILLSHLLQLSRVQLYVQFERHLLGSEVEQYRHLVKRRAENEPLQYITGQCEFMGLQFKVNPDVLIPRPETEFLVEQVLHTLKQLDITSPRILDIGTGSGCIAVSLAHHFPRGKVIATDISPRALLTAQENAIANEVKNIEFKEHDVLHHNFNLHKLDIIVSNPPYVAQSEMKTLSSEITNYEPEMALTDHGDGLTFYKKILSLIDKDLTCKFVFMELNANLSADILELTKEYSFRQIEVIPDLNNHPRILKIET